MILEGLVTTLNADGSPHLAPMGPRVSPEFTRFTLRPYPTSTTGQNLLRHPQGVLHVTDNVLTLAQAAVGQLAEFPQVTAASQVDGVVLRDACRYFEFEIVEADTSSERMCLEAVVKHQGTLRDFFGFNRAKHAVLEAAIFCTRLQFLNWADVRAEFDKLWVIVHKTAGEQELAAMRFLDDYLQRWPHDAS